MKMEEKKVRGRLFVQEKSDAEDTQEEEEDEEEEEEEETPTPAAAAAPNGYKVNFHKFCAKY
jgi:hypothetical protein